MTVSVSAEAQDEHSSRHGPQPRCSIVVENDKGVDFTPTQVPSQQHPRYPEACKGNLESVSRDMMINERKRVDHVLVDRVEGLTVE